MSDYLNSYGDHIVQPWIIENHMNIRDVLKEKQIDDFAFILDENQNQTFLIKGIEGNYSAEAVFAELQILRKCF